MEEFNTQFSTEPKQSPEDDRVPLWKQVAGAVIGGSLALGLYYGYEFAKPKVTAYLTLPVAEGGRMFDLGAASIADKSLEDKERKRIVSRNLQAAERMMNLPHDPSRMVAADDHSLDIDWPGHTAKQTEVASSDADEEATEEPETSDKEVAFEVYMEEDMTSDEPDVSEDDWENLWGDIREREGGVSSNSTVERSNANALPDTGISLVVIAAGAAGGAMGLRKRKKRETV